MIILFIAVAIIAWVFMFGDIPNPRGYMSHCRKHGHVWGKDREEDTCQVCGYEFFVNLF